MGCTGCHPSSDPELAGLRKIGPDLRRIASKTTPEWAYRWIESPRDFRPTTWMPHFFTPREVESEAERRQRASEIRGIVAYLWTSSERVDYPSPPAGDPDRGEGVFESCGCTGCHVRDGQAERLLPRGPPPPRAQPGADRQQGRERRRPRHHRRRRDAAAGSRVVCEHLPFSGMYATFFSVFFDTSQCTMRFAGAGHPPALHTR